jgi:hypothetical protein
MAEPIPKWYEVDSGTGDESVCLSWNAGTVDAGQRSAVKEVYIWNNKGGVASVSDMTNVFITSKHTDGTDGGLVATKQAAVVEVSTYDGVTWSGWNEVGGSAETVPLVSSSGVNGTISGASNDGNRFTNATKANYARVQMRLWVKDTAPAGLIQWRTRVSYQYT